MKTTDVRILFERARFAQVRQLGTMIGRDSAATHCDNTTIGTFSSSPALSAIANRGELEGSFSEAARPCINWISRR